MTRAAPTIPPADAGAGPECVLVQMLELRGRAVLAYCERVARSGTAVDAAVEAFAALRREAGASTTDATDLDAVLLRATRYAAAEHAPLIAGVGASCADIHRRLAARQSGDAPAGGEHLDRHLGECEICMMAAIVLLAAEYAYEDPPSVDLAPEVSSRILALLRGSEQRVREAPRTPAPSERSGSETEGSAGRRSHGVLVPLLVAAAVGATIAGIARDADRPESRGATETATRPEGRAPLRSTAFSPTLRPPSLLPAPRTPPSGPRPSPGR